MLPSPLPRAMPADSPAEAFERLVTLNRSLLTQHLLRGLAHDLRNDLQVVTLGAGGPGPVPPAMAARLDQAIEAMSTTLDALGRLGRVESEDESPSDLDAVLREVGHRVGLMRNLPDGRLEIDPVPSGTTVAIAPSRLVQAFLNMVVAAKAAGAETIRVRMGACRSGTIDIVVEDDGGDRAFDPGSPPLDAQIGYGMAAGLLHGHGGAINSAGPHRNQVTLTLPLSGPGSPVPEASRRRP